MIEKQREKEEKNRKKDSKETEEANMQTYERRKKENLTASMHVILLKDRSSQPSFNGWAKKWLRMYWRPVRSVMLLLLRRMEQLRYFPFEFVFKGRRPLRGISDNAPESEIHSTVLQFFLYICIYIYVAKSVCLRWCIAVSTLLSSQHLTRENNWQICHGRSHH